MNQDTKVADPWVMEVGGKQDAPSLAVREPERRAYASAVRQHLVGTSQQEAFWAEMTDGSGHCLLEARAGSGKSSSAREAMWRIQDRKPDSVIRYTCFNKKIAEEFREKCPPGVDVGTMHSFGFASLQASYGSVLDKNKTYTILDGLGAADMKRYTRRAIANVVSLAKNHGLNPDGIDLRPPLQALITHFDVECYWKEDEVISWASKVLHQAAEMTSVIDFDDMLWLCTVVPVTFPSVDFVFIDEAQDLSPVQHDLAELLSGSGRTIIIGDVFQSIYAFRGADSQSIPKLQAKLDAKVLPLTVTFRCPRLHVELAQQLVPDFEAAPNAAEGTLIQCIGNEAIDAAVPGDLVLCRANAPVVQACLRQIANLVPATVRGRAIGESLLAIVRKVGEVATIDQFCHDLEVWKAKEIIRLSRKDGTDDLIEATNDKAMSLDAVASACASPVEIPGVIERLFADDDSANRVTFSSVHRAKGSEAERVLYIQIPYGEKKDREKPPQQFELDQRRNLRYVAISRSLDSLTLITPEPNKKKGFRS